MNKIIFVICMGFVSTIFSMQEDCPHWCAPEDQTIADIEEVPSCLQTAKKIWARSSVDESKQLNQQILCIRNEIESATVYEMANLNLELKRLQARQRQLLEE